MTIRSLSRLPFLLLLPLALLCAAPAGAQQECSQCNQFSSCGEPCMYCILFNQDGCQEYAESSCGEPCMQCTPNFVEVSREVRGTYGNGSMFSCSHHKVELVTLYDTNQCNTNPTYWYTTNCQDSVDGGKSGWFPDCCNGYGPGGVPDSTYTCNHHHSC